MLLEITRKRWRRRYFLRRCRRPGSRELKHRHHYHQGQAVIDDVVVLRASIVAGLFERWS